MRLAQYLELTKTSDRDFAEKIGVERQAVHRYKMGERFPERPILQKIFQATDGAVTPNDFVELSPASGVQ